MSDLHDDTNARTLTGPWRVSTFTNQGNCVQVAPTAGGVAVRNSNAPLEGTLYVSAAALATVLDGTRAGELDDLAR
jgi:hypothetical protein